MVKGHQEAVKNADRFVIGSAVAVQQYIQDNGSCPKQLDGWSLETNYDGYQQEIWSGNESLRVPIFFKCEADLSFNYIVKYGMDSGIYLSGKPEQDIKLTYGHFTELKHLYISKNSNLAYVVEKIHE